MSAVTGFSVETISGMPVVTASAEIDVASSELLRAALVSAARGGHATLVVDLSQTGFCDSTGLNVLVRAHKRAAAEGGELRLVIGTAPVLRIFSVTGVDHVIPIFATLADALSELPAIAIQPQSPSPSPWAAT